MYALPTSVAPVSAIAPERFACVLAASAYSDVVLVPTASVKDFVAVCGFGAESKTRTVNAYEPAVVGVPLIVPLAASDRPGGGAPLEIVHVYGGTPSVTARAVLYAVPTVP